jgi:putative serine protease PepD
MRTSRPVGRRTHTGPAADVQGAHSIREQHHGTGTDPESRWTTMTLDRPATMLLESSPTRFDEPPTPLPLPAAAPPRPTRRHRRTGLVPGVAVLALVAGAGGGFLGSRLVDDTAPATTVLSSPTIDATTVATSTETVALVAEAMAPSVVSVTVTTGGSTSEGSGLVYSAAGLILTNAHVVAGAGEGGRVQVTFADGSTAPATVVGADSDSDIAVLQAQGASRLTPAALGTAEDLQVGDAVIAFGSPLGLEGTVTSGIVSALHRSVEIGEESPGPFGAATSTTLSDAIQTDAAVNPGNSGGPLVDTTGRVVGITTAMASVNGTAGSIGIGFAIPIETARDVAERLVAAA